MATGLLARRHFFVRERVAMLKFTDTYDLLDPETQQPIGIARELISGWMHFWRLFVNKRILPTTVAVFENEGAAPVLTMHRGFTFLRAKVDVFNGEGRPLGYFKSKIFSLGGGLDVYGMDDQPIAEVKGDWKGWNFRFLDKSGNELGTVAKKWAGLAKELFTSADNYALMLRDEFEGDASLLLSAALALDIIFKERS